MSKPRMTEAQARATHPKLNAFVGASAGTGKTHVLTARVLRLMLRLAHHEDENRRAGQLQNILCLTFTKAAAAEMVSRIFQELGRWALMDDAELIAEIERRTEEQADAQMLSWARQLFVEVLELEGGLRIQTFHSFCQSLLGRFPLEAGIMPGFEAIEEAEQREVMQSARDRMLLATRTAAGAAMRKALDLVATLVTENTFDEVINQLTFAQGTLSAAQQHYGGNEGVLSALDRMLGLNGSETPDSLLEDATNEGAFDQLGLTRLTKAMAEGSKAEAGRSFQISAFLIASDQAARQAAFSEYQAVFLTTKGEPRKTVATKKTLDNDPSLREVIEREQERLADFATLMLKVKAATATKALLTLGMSQLHAYKELKGTRGLVDFDDMIRGARGLLTQAGDADWILFKLDGGIDHILVDEAQDTNFEQWQVIEQIANEFFAGESASEADRSIFAVGDVKQSIFSFQHADPREFTAARDRIFKRAQDAGAEAANVPLALSFRSGEAVLSLVDHVFQHGSRAAQGLSIDDEKIQHDFIRQGIAGSVELWPLQQSRGTDDDGDDVTWQAPTVRMPKLDGDETCAMKIADHVAAMIGKRPLESQGRAVRAGDILVLVRKRSAFVDHLTKAFRARGVPIAGRDRMKLTDELVIKDLIALGETVLMPTDDLTLASLIRSPLLNLSEDDLFQLSHGRKGSLIWAFEEAAKAHPTGHIAQAYERLKSWLGRSDRLDPFAFYSGILDQDGGRNLLAARLGNDIHDPIDAFLAEARIFMQSRPGSLRGFLTALGRSNKTLKRDFDMSADEIRIMTVHSAKGLQAPIVILADTTSLPTTTQDGRLLPLGGDEEKNIPPLLMWTSPAGGLKMVDDMKLALKERLLAEYRRLLYVALTRAEDHLIIAGWQGKREVPDDSWYKLIEAGLDRMTGVTTLPNGARQFTVAQTKPVTPQKPKQASGDTQEITRPAWLDRDRPEEPNPPRPLSPSRPISEIEPPALSPLAADKRYNFKRGRMIHQLFEILPTLPVIDRYTAAERIVSQPAHELSDALQTDIISTVFRVLEDPEFGDLFSTDARSEVSLSGAITAHNKPYILSAKVDRLLVDDDRVLLVDFKTDRRPPETIQDVPKEYAQQMAYYRLALKGLFKNRVIKTALLWTESATLMALDDDYLSSLVE